MIQKTLVLIKPDGVARSLTGEILNRFEKAGLKIIGMKMLKPNNEIADKHYNIKIAEKYGNKIRNKLLAYIKSGPVIAVVLEGINAVENIRKLTGDTYPNNALPGTIRGDYAHISREYADADDKKTVMNLIHASENKKEAKFEINLWFKQEELHEYENVHEKHTR